MMTRSRDKSRFKPGATVSAAAGMSWMALVAATTFGAGQFDCVRAEIQAEDPLEADEDGTYRLIVQSYDRSSVDADSLPAEFARPRGSVQRAITSKELKNGVSVDLVNVSSSAEDAVVVAWIERGQADLELDGLKARPARGAFVGSNADPRSAGPVRVLLKHRDA